MKNFLQLCTTLTLFFFSTLLFADPATNPAKEETTPPPAEGALTLDQTPPIMNIGKPLPAPTPAPAETSQTVQPGAAPTGTTPPAAPAAPAQ